MDFLITFILVVILSFYLLGTIGRFLLRWYIQKKMKSGASQGYNPFGGFGGQGQNQSGNEPDHKEGEVFLSKTPPKEKQVNDSIGEYVDFEEVE